MNLAMSMLMLFVGCCLMWVAVHGTESSTPWGVFQEIAGGLTGNPVTGGAGETESGTTGREESATAGAGTDPNQDPSYVARFGRTNEPAGPPA